MVAVLEDALVLEDIDVPGFERVIKVSDESVGLKAIICMHSSAMGPTLGGTRLFSYPNFEAGLTDVKRLAEGMTYKSTLAGTGYGGAKSVIFADPKRNREKLFLSFGRAVERLKGKYICAEDVGTTPEDMLVVNRENPYVVGLPHEKSSGNPSPYTAWGTVRGIQSVLKKVYGSDDIQGRTIAIQGLGSVGTYLADHLFWAGARLILADINKEKTALLAKKYGAVACDPQEIFSMQCDVFAPCAMGGAINKQTIPQLNCRAIAGCANNQLLTSADGDELKRRGILYAPDFVINAGGLINVIHELEPQGYNPIPARDKIHQIYDQLLLIYDIAEQNKVSTHAAAVSLADYRLKYGIGKRQTPVYFHHSNVRIDG